MRQGEKCISFAGSYSVFNLGELIRSDQVKNLFHSQEVTTFKKFGELVEKRWNLLRRGGELLLLKYLVNLLIRGGKCISFTGSYNF